jgi:hypothetical protein
MKNYDPPDDDSEFDGRIMRKSFTSEGFPPNELKEESINIVKRKKNRKKDKDGCC